MDETKIADVTLSSGISSGPASGNSVGSRTGRGA